MSLPSSIVGTPAGVGARLAAFTIDVVLIAIVAAAVGVFVSPVLGVVVVVEALLGLWILQARLGVGPGAVLLGLRVSRLDAPYSPGGGRAFVRGSLLVLGALVLVAGAWVVLASAAWDRSGLRRAWIDKAAGTVVVSVSPRRASDPAYALATPTVSARASAAGRGTPRAVDAAASALPIAPEWGVALDQGVLVPAPASAQTSTATAPPPAAGAAPVVVVPPVQPSPTVADVRAAVPAAGPAAPETAAPAAVAASVPTASPAMTAAQLLIVFDTGQREQFALPVAVNLGRAPVATEVGDVLVAVDDPDRMVSKTHLRLEHDGETAWVTDAGSTNGSELVDDDGSARVLAPGVRTLLDDGVRVRLGERVFTVSRLIGGPA